MGLDITIFGIGKTFQDEKNRDTWNITVLKRLNNFHKMNEILIWKYPNYDNCTTIDISIEELKDILQELKENKQEIVNGDIPKRDNESEEQYNSRINHDLMNYNAEINGLEEFLNSDDILDFEDLQIRGWW